MPITTASIKAEQDKDGIPGWCNKQDQAWLAAQAKRHNLIVEIGVWRGRSAAVLCQNCPGTVIAVDHFRGGKGQTAPGGACAEAATFEGQQRVREDAISNLSAYLNAGKLFLLEMESVEAADLIRNLTKYRSLDMVYIDGSHDFHSVRNDIAAYRPLIRSGGMICGHDHSEVKAAVVQAFGAEYQTGTEKIWWKIL